MTKTLNQKLNDLTKATIKKAMKYIDVHSVYEINKHRSWLLVCENKLYPVKEVVRRAYRIQYNVELTNEEESKIASVSAIGKLLHKGFTTRKEKDLDLKKYTMYKVK